MKLQLSIEKYFTQCALKITIRATTDILLPFREKTVKQNFEKEYLGNCAIHFNQSFIFCN